MALAAKTTSRLTPRRFVKEVLKSMIEESGLEGRLFGQFLRITDAQEGTVHFELRIRKQHVNRLKILHGGTIASLVDLGGSLAVASHGLWSTGVSTDLNVTYISSGPGIGHVLRATAICDKLGETLAYTRVAFFDMRNNLVARGHHTKFVAQAVATSKPFVPPQGVVDVKSPKSAKSDMDKAHNKKKEALFATSDNKSGSRARILSLLEKDRPPTDSGSMF
ncbi:6256961d-ec7e-4848-81b2-7d1fce90c316 [Thermothielavioides terrestris]|uniref:6256961d-ec7e-4848-81b2-7d1fce90c316 n=1 Tax=Thermothielavioides terrestris TaxID=2587410 RepID=A0A3S4D9Y8_9PEZI|nr:6256961d-ec7e-4848-81b2-7d1fce90c316 [Thermothielavioides terrestris]